jgi:hypothetical protein
MDVYNDDLSIGCREILFEHADDGLLNEAFVIVRIDENADAQTADS